MFARSYRARPFGRLVEIDLYTPRVAIDRRGLNLHADNLLVVRWSYRDWRFVVGVKVLGFGVAVALPR